MSESKKEARKDLFVGIGIGVVVVAIWLSSWWLILKNLKEPSGPGTFGDQFGAVNSLFSGLALAGIIYTIILQRKELQHQRKELQLTRKELEFQREELKMTRLATDEQSKTMMIQRVDNTFFNLITMIDERRADVIRQSGVNIHERFRRFRSYLISNRTVVPVLTTSEFTGQEMSLFSGLLNYADLLIDTIRLILTLPQEARPFYLNILSTQLFDGEKLMIVLLVQYHYMRALTVGENDLVHLFGNEEIPFGPPI